MDENTERAKGSGEMVRSLFVLLVVTGVGVGMLVSMEIRGRQRRAGLVADNHQLQTQLAFVEAKHGEMLSFLGRPQTELVKLTGAQEWAGQAVTVAWNPVQRAAVVLVDRLPGAPEGMAYHLRAMGAKGADVLGELDAGAPAQRVYTVPANLGEPAGFEITLDRAGEAEGRAVFVPVRT